MTQLVVIAIYLLALLVLGLFAGRLSRGTSSDYLLASHSIGPFLLLMSLFGTTMTAFALVGSTGESFKEGIGVYGQLASSSGIIHSLCFFVIGLRLWSLGRKHGYRTQIQFFRDRLENDWIGYLLFPVLVGLVIPYLLIGVLAAGTVVNSASEGAFTTAFAQYDYGLPQWLGSLIICGIVLIYVFYGGMRGTAWANTFQTLVFMVLGIVTFWVISDKLGGPTKASQAVLAANPSKLMREVTPEEEESYERSLGSWQSLADYKWAAAEGRLTLTGEQRSEAHAQFKPRMPLWQQRAEAVYAKKQGLLKLSTEDAQRARLALDDRVIAEGETLLTADGTARQLAAFPRSATWQKRALTLFADKIGHPAKPADASRPDGPRKWSRKKAMGVYRATHWAPNAPHPMSKLKFFTYLLVPLSVGMFPHLFQHWLTARSAASFKLPIVAHPLFIMIVWVPCVLVGVWATSAVVDGRPLIPDHFPPNAVLAYMVNQLSSPLLGGLLTAGILAAIMSSLDSQFLCLGTIFTQDIVLHRGKKRGLKISDRGEVLLARAFIVAIVAVTYSLSLFEPRRVFTLGVWCFSGFSSLFPLVVAAVYWRKLTAMGAVACVLAAITSWAYFFWQSGMGSNPRYSFDLTIAGQTYQMMPVAPMFACSLVAMVLVSLLTKPPSAGTLAKFFD